MPILVGFTTNSITKIALAVASGSRAFALRVVPGLIVVLAAAWAGFIASGRRSRHSRLLLTSETKCAGDRPRLGQLSIAWRAMSVAE